MQERWTEWMMERERLMRRSEEELTTRLQSPRQAGRARVVAETRCEGIKEWSEIDVRVLLPVLVAVRRLRRQ
jgi:hypothetical protein